MILLFCILTFSYPLQAQSLPHPPPFSEVQNILCKEYQLSRDLCKESSFESQSFDLNEDNKLEWVYTNLKGPLTNCFVRQACFSILQETSEGWKIVFSSMGESVTFEKVLPSQNRDLLVSAANTACERDVRVFSWNGKVYMKKAHATCNCEIDYRKI